MKRSIRISAAIAAALGLGLAALAALGEPAGMEPNMTHGTGHGAAGGHAPMTGTVGMLSTSADTKVVAALQGHAKEVTELVEEGPLAMRRGMMSRMAEGLRSPRSGRGPDTAPAATEHAH